MSARQIDRQTIALIIATLIALAILTPATAGAAPATPETAPRVNWNSAPAQQAITSCARAVEIQQWLGGRVRCQPGSATIYAYGAGWVVTLVDTSTTPRIRWYRVGGRR